MIITWPAISIPETYMSLGVSTKCISGYLGPGIIIDQTILYLWHHQQEQKKKKLSETAIGQFTPKVAAAVCLL